jgi:hypothetical protein
MKPIRQSPPNLKMNRTKKNDKPRFIWSKSSQIKIQKGENNNETNIQ